MDHLAIMKKSWGLLPKIFSGEKKIESRWYQTKHLPWDKIRAGDTVYFKNSGEPVILKVTVKKVLQYSSLTPEKVRQILEEYRANDGIAYDRITYYYNLFKDKKYCLLIFLENPQAVTPFEIDKKGFGTMAAWITIENINLIKKE